MEPFLVNFNELACTISDQKLKSHKAQKTPPYLFISSDKRVTWGDAELFLATQPKVEKVHLFACFKSGLFFLGEKEVKNLKPLYLTPSIESFKEEADQEIALQALLYHEKASSDDCQLNKVFFTQMRECVDEKIGCLMTKTLLRVAKLSLLNEKEKALHLFFELAKKGDPTACYEYAELLPEGTQSKLRYPWYEKAALAETPHPLASFKAATILQKWDNPEYTQKKRILFLQAAVNGNKEAAFQAALMCKEGVGGEKNLQKAEELFLESVKEKGGEAYYELGQINIELGLPVAAINYYRQAKNLQHAKASLQLEALSGKESDTQTSPPSAALKKDLSSSSSGLGSPSSSRKKSLIEYSRKSSRSLSQGEGCDIKDLSFDDSFNL
jgi:tetratricopeptide (TPR) repeat protein